MLYVCVTDAALNASIGRAKRLKKRAILIINHTFCAKSVVNLILVVSGLSHS